jgi:hypothetical protein
MAAASVPGARLFRAGAIVYIVFAAVHMLPFLKSLLVAPTDPLEIDAQRALRAVVVDMGPFHTDFGQLVELLSASYSLLLALVGTLNLVALPAAATAGRLRALTLVNLAFCAVLVVVPAIYQFPPPLVFALIIETLFALSLARQPTG